MITGKYILWLQQRRTKMINCHEYGIINPWTGIISHSFKTYVLFLFREYIISEYKHRYISQQIQIYFVYKNIKN